MTQRRSCNPKRKDMPREVPEIVEQRSRLLSRNAELKALYVELVNGGVVAEDEFWKAQRVDGCNNGYEDDGGIRVGDGDRRPGQQRRCEHARAHAHIAEDAADLLRESELGAAVEGTSATSGKSRCSELPAASELARAGGCADGRMSQLVCTT